MIKQKIHIIDCETLYNILIEIKNSLSFHVLHFLNEKEILKLSNYNKVDIKKSLFLTKKSNDYLINNLKIDQKQIIHLVDTPIDIYTLVEKINIQLLKLRYNYQSRVILNDYTLDLNSREINKGKKKLKLTEKEIDTILFLYNKKTPQSIKNLLSEVWGYLNDVETHTVETHIHRLRKKIKNQFNDEDFIISYDEGYKI
jgi:DNA-binding response OmpR family regulator